MQAQIKVFGLLPLSKTGLCNPGVSSVGKFLNVPVLGMSERGLFELQAVPTCPEDNSKTRSRILCLLKAEALPRHL